MSAELFGYIAKRGEDGKFIDIPLYDRDKEIVTISIGNASAFRELFDTFINNAAYSVMEKQDDENEPVFFNNRWDKTHYINIDRMRVMMYRLKEKIDVSKVLETFDIYDLNDDELLYYMLDEFLDQISKYIEFADPFGYGDEYYFKFYISY